MALSGLLQLLFRSGLKPKTAQKRTFLDNECGTMLVPCWERSGCISIERAKVSFADHVPHTAKLKSQSQRTIISPL
jgi:hypothetical protein